jgi:hypothetical protein
MSSSTAFHKTLNRFSVVEAVQELMKWNTSLGGRILCGILLVCASVGRSEAAEDSPHLPFSAGETIYYDIEKLGLKVGEAAIVFHGSTQIEGRGAFLITVTSHGFRFFDEEKIYVDPLNFLPVRVERNLNVFGKKEQIVEYYDTLKGGVRVVKTAKGKTTQQIIRKGNILDNIYSFVFRYRKTGGFRIGDKAGIHLPTRDVEFFLERTEQLNVSDKDYTAYYMHSIPVKYRVWFDQGHNKIPLRIDGAVGFGKTSMVLREYRM